MLAVSPVILNEPVPPLDTHDPLAFRSYSISVIAAPLFAGRLAIVTARADAAPVATDQFASTKASGAEAATVAVLAHEICINSAYTSSQSNNVRRVVFRPYPFP